MSRPELDGWLAALSALNGKAAGKKAPASSSRTTTHQSFKSRRQKRHKGKRTHGR
ncbi:hypothetical protein [Aeromonas veronii]|jgi:hypothetical protein|uniref:hypothetical protein n=1 Tax=Aeromonas veronii TaxID=654 RepID=UPI0013C2FBD0|nr:hypothetical protein [Aeromonas veronii]